MLAVHTTRICSVSVTRPWLHTVGLIPQPPLVFRYRRAFGRRAGALTVAVAVREAPAIAVPRANPPGYFNSRLMRRSASFFPCVWQVGQYWWLESALATSAMVSPHTSHG